MGGGEAGRDKMAGRVKKGGKGGETGDGTDRAGQ